MGPTDEKYNNIKFQKFPQPNINANNHILIIY